MTKSTVESASEVAGVVETQLIQVLHVDDEAGFLKAAKQILEMQGNFQVETALSVEEAMEKLEQKKFDVVVSDYVMPGKTGLDFLKALRQKGDMIPFIIFTGKGREEAAIKALNLGADLYFNKIGDPETVYYEWAHGIRRILERRKAFSLAKQREERLKAIFASSPDAIIISDIQGNVIDCNEATLKLTGYPSKEQVIGRSSYEFIAGKDREKAMNNLKRTLEEGMTKNLEYTLLKKNGEKYQGELSASILEDSTGNPIGFVGILRDITERKKIEDALKISEEKYRNIVELAPDGIITINLKGVIDSVNTAFLKLTGHSREEIVGKHFTKLQTLRARDIPQYLRLLHSILRGKLPPPFESPYIRKDGTIGWGEYHVGLLKNGDKLTGFQVICREITRQKQAEKMTAESKEKFRHLFYNNPEAAIHLDADFHILGVNPRFEELFGYSANEIRGLHINEVTVPKDKMEEAQMLDRKAQKGYVYHDTVRKKRDGTLVSVSLSAAPIEVGGRIVGYVGVYKDISRLKRTEDQLKETLEKLSVVGKLTRHDARNKLSTVAMNVFLARQMLPDNPEAMQHLREVESAVRQTERIFDFARIYEKLGMEELVYMDVGKSLSEAAKLFSNLPDIKVVNDCHGLTVMADSLLRQLFYNLIDNSLKHGEKVSQVKAYYEVGKDSLKLVYEDNGVGIPKAEKENIFKEGYGKGTGYGLYLIKKMCEVYGWTIKETSKQSNKGAQFTITIPKMGEKGKILYKLP